MPRRPSSRRPAPFVYPPHRFTQAPFNNCRMCHYFRSRIYYSLSRTNGCRGCRNSYRFLRRIHNILSRASPVFNTRLSFEANLMYFVNYHRSLNRSAPISFPNYIINRRLSF